jgi:hypothetical protein
MLRNIIAVDGNDNGSPVNGISIGLARDSFTRNKQKINSL